MVDPIKHCFDVEVSNVQGAVEFTMQFREKSWGKNSIDGGASGGEAILLRSAGFFWSGWIVGQKYRANTHPGSDRRAIER